MAKYRFDFASGHIIFRDGGRLILFDSGSTFSIGAHEAFTFEGNQFSLLGDYLGVGLETLTELVGHPFDIVMGPEVIETFDVRIEPTGKTIHFGGNLRLSNSIEIPLDSHMRIPIMKVNIRSDPVLLFFDTGAKLSYIAPDYMDGMTPLAKREDFYPTLGHLQRRYMGCR